MLEARNLTKYYAAIPAIRDVSFTLAPGAILGLLGPNGSGKSTTVSILTGLLEPSGGRVYFDGLDTRERPLDYKARVGYVPEEAHLYTYLTGPEYLALIGRLRSLPEAPLRQKIAAFLEVFGLTGDQHAPMSAYSKGMRQKILISAALLHDPQIIVFDEPNSGLDVTSSLVLRSLVQALAAEGRMVVYSSHVLEIVEQVATDVLILHRHVSSAVARLATRHPVERAVAGFTLRTVARSRTHLILLATYVGVAAALVLSALIPLISRRGMTTLDTPDEALLSVSLVFNFLVLCGMRVLFAIPTEIKANWAFRIHAPDDRMLAAIGGVRTALLLSVVAPIAFVAGVVGVTLWGARTGVLHGLFTAALGMLLVDVLLVGLRKIPFTCTYYPGRSRARTFGPLYAIAFSTYAYSLAILEIAILSRPLLLGAVFVVVAALSAGLAHLRRRDLQPPPGLTYEEEDPDDMFGSFRLSEGLAAESPVTPRASRHIPAK